MIISRVKIFRAVVVIIENCSQMAIAETFQSKIWELLKQEFVIIWHCFCETNGNNFTYYNLHVIGSGSAVSIFIISGQFHYNNYSTSQYESVLKVREPTFFCFLHTMLINVNKNYYVMCDVTYAGFALKTDRVLFGCYQPCFT